MKYVAVIIVLLCLSVAEAKTELTDEKRDNALRRGQVWHPVEVSKVNILAGPQNEVSVPFGSLVKCEYVETKEKLTGRWPKFLCKTAKGHVVRVKYGMENKEIYAEAAATRLFWALGFYADEVYPVEVECLNCPANPFQPDSGNRGKFLFKDANMERNFPGITIEEKEDEGWTWKELEKVDPEKGGASRTHVDALRLLAAFVQHADAKPDNQRIACYKEQVQDPDKNGKGYCAQPVLMIQDLGATFGAGLDVFKISRMDLKAWKTREIWNTELEARTREKTGIGYCIANITTSYLAGQEGLTDPIISDAGRQFLAGLLNQLSDRQIREIFTLARVDQLDEMIEDNGTKRKVTVEDWVKVFKEKRAAIQEHNCPPPEGEESD